jgi:hypothetical protein
MEENLIVTIQQIVGFVEMVLIVPLARVVEDIIPLL